jgi:hypothetical protein
MMKLRLKLKLRRQIETAGTVARSLVKNAEGRQQLKCHLKLEPWPKKRDERQQLKCHLKFESWKTSAFPSAEKRRELKYHLKLEPWLAKEKRREAAAQISPEAREAANKLRRQKRQALDK